MLLILIPTAWLLIVALFVVLCRMAARGDAALVARPQRGTVSHSFPGLVLFEPSGVAGDELVGARREASVSSHPRRSHCVAR